MVKENELLRVKFYIDDVCFNSKYEYVGHFASMGECSNFIDENEADGNTVIVLGMKFINKSDVDLEKCSDYEF